MSWRTVYRTTEGNGGVDDVTFALVEARYVRLPGVQRGTNTATAVRVAVFAH